MCDVALGLMNAYKMGMEECIGYNINRAGTLYPLKSSFRMLKIIKNRLSRDEITIGLLFMPKSGKFKELPIANVMTEDNYKWAVDITK